MTFANVLLKREKVQVPGSQMNILSKQRVDPEKV